MRKLLLSLALAALITLPAHFGYAVIPDETLVLYMPFDEGGGNIAEDQSIYGHHGEVKEAEWVDGKFRKAIKASKVGEDCVRIPHVDTLVIEGEITMMSWISIPEYNQAAHNQWLDKSCHNGGENKCYGMYLTKGCIGVRVGSDQGRQLFGCPPDPVTQDVELNKWQHVAFTYDGSAGVIYLNGELLKKETISFHLEGTNTFDLMIGTPHPLSGAQAFTFNGAIDEVVIYSRALNKTEINQVMNGGLTAVFPKGKLSTTWASIKN